MQLPLRKKYNMTRKTTIRKFSSNETHLLLLLLLLPFYGPLSGTTRVCRYQKKHSPTQTFRGHQSSFISFLHLLWSVSSYLFNLLAGRSKATYHVC